MREDRQAVRGETGRVAARVRELLGAGRAAHHHDGDYDDDCADGDEQGFAPGFGLRPARPSVWAQLAARVPVRLDPGRRGALAVGLAVLLAAVVTGVWLASSRPQAVAVSAAVPSIPGSIPLVGTGLPTGSVAATGSALPSPAGLSPAGPAVSVSSTGSASAAEIVVDVAGKVRHPGVYRLAAGSRVDDAVQAAGGPIGRVDLSSLNLAALLVDGQQVAVGLSGATAPVAPAGVGGSTGSATDGTAGPVTIVDLNSASLDQLETLPGVGPVLGQNILDWRTAHGTFTSIDQLQDVSGIGDVKFAALQPLVTL